MTPILTYIHMIYVRAPYMSYMSLYDNYDKYDVYDIYIIWHTYIFQYWCQKISYKKSLGPKTETSYLYFSEFRLYILFSSDRRNQARDLKFFLVIHEGALWWYRGCTIWYLTFGIFYLAYIIYEQHLRGENRRL